MNILLCGAVVMIVISLMIAWMVTFAKYFVMPGFSNLAGSADVLLKGHIDYVLMSLFCLAFYAVKIPLPDTLCWIIVVGGITNPGIFLIIAFKSDCWKYWMMRVYTATTFLLTTIGFLWVCSGYVSTASAT